MNYSLTYVGIIVSVIGFILDQLGVPIDKEQLKNTVAFLLTLVGSLVALYGRFRKGDISVLGVKEEV
mgnify:FL=1